MKTIFSVLIMLTFYNSFSQTESKMLQGKEIYFVIEIFNNINVINSSFYVKNDSNYFWIPDIGLQFINLESFDSMNFNALSMFEKKMLKIAKKKQKKSIKICLDDKRYCYIFKFQAKYLYKITYKETITKCKIAIFDANYEDVKLVNIDGVALIKILENYY